MEISNSLMDYFLCWRQVFFAVFSLDIIPKFSKIVILEFSDSLTQILVFFCPKKQNNANQIFFRWPLNSCEIVAISFVFSKSMLWKSSSSEKVATLKKSLAKVGNAVYCFSKNLAFSKK